MTKNVKVALAAVAVVVLVLALVLFPFGKGNATNTEACVPTPETTATVVVTPAVPATPGTPAIPAVPPVTQTIPAVAEVWANWSPDNQQGPFTGPPAYPTDPRGTWHVHNKIPGGHEGPDGVYQRDNPGKGNADWFYRQNAQPEKIIVISEGTPEVPAVPGTPEIPAVTQTVVTPAVVCDTPSETPTVTPEPEDETPVSNPEPPKPPKDVQVTECVNGVFVTTVNGEVVAESGSCDEATSVAETPVEAQEEGL